MAERPPVVGTPVVTSPGHVKKKVKVAERPPIAPAAKKSNKPKVKHLGLPRRTSGRLRTSKMRTIFKGPGSSSEAPLVIHDDDEMYETESDDGEMNVADNGDGNYGRDGELTQETINPKIGLCMAALRAFVFKD